MARPKRFFARRSPNWRLPSACGDGAGGGFARGVSRRGERAGGGPQAGLRLLNWEETEYPQRLLEIYDPPPLLYVRGDVQVLRRHSISMVGTRRPTPYGNQIAERLARDLAERGLVIVSGLARGIDSSAHRGACAASRGATIGVLGCGIDVIYPKENRKLFAEVEKRGAIVSEFPLGTHPAPENFPVRNRIVAGMALGVIVVQGAQYSGSLITSRLAMEFGREVFGVPGNITEAASFAPNQLIKQGAKLVTGWEDVVEELPTEIRAELFPVEATTAEERASLFEQALSPTEKKLYELHRHRRADSRGRTGGDDGAELVGNAGGAVRDGNARNDPADAGETVRARCACCRG